jgi:quercetin dioxygenase-like cupin family protein
MPQLIGSPTRIQAAGNKPKFVDEYFGVVNTNETKISVAHVCSPAGWEEPGQCPEFHEYTVVLKGMLRVEHERGTIDVQAGQGVHTHPGEWVRYSTPSELGAEYVAVCLPAFARSTVHRDE